MTIEVRYAQKDARPATQAAMDAWLAFVAEIHGTAVDTSAVSYIAVSFSLSGHGGGSIVGEVKIGTAEQWIETANTAGSLVSYDGTNATWVKYYSRPVPVVDSALAALAITHPDIDPATQELVRATIVLGTTNTVCAGIVATATPHDYASSFDAGSPLGDFIGTEEI